MCFVLNNLIERNAINLKSIEHATYCVEGEGKNEWEKWKKGTLFVINLDSNPRPHAFYPHILWMLCIEGRNSVIMRWWFILFIISCDHRCSILHYYFKFLFIPLILVPAVQTDFPMQRLLFVKIVVTYIYNAYRWRNWGSACYAFNRHLITSVFQSV